MLNVLISASIVKRHRGKVRLAEHPLIHITDVILPSDRESFELLKLQAQDKLNQIKKKR